ncbi:MAG: D-TA family PLP-dependent enzyme [Planctomycetes bacterium]|nr:D-TA family PLP-dependent enzyme [Planctomycetota bacterium]
MDPRYAIADTRELITPALVVFRELLEDNLARMIAIARDVRRLRPHCKTHKMPHVTRLELERGITKHKAATFAEAEMLAGAGARNILLAYHLVGPNVARAVRFVETFPDLTFSVIADHPRPLAELSEAMRRAGHTIDVLLDVDTGQHRTGVPVGEDAFGLYRKLAHSPGLAPGGLHVYDGHQHQSSRDERRAAIDAEWAKVIEFRDRLSDANLAVPRIVAGGTGSFPVYAEKDDPTIELSPGTCVFHDAGYGSLFPDLVFTPAALLLTRVISRPTPDRLTLDLGYKAVASDPPAGRRVVFPDLPDAEQILQNEEHLVLSTARADEFQPGDELLAIPRHVCPTSALHKEAYVVAEGRIVDRWAVTARDRRLTI